MTPRSWPVFTLTPGPAGAAPATLAAASEDPLCRRGLSGIRGPKPPGTESGISPSGGIGMITRKSDTQVSHCNPRGVTLLANHSSGQSVPDVTRRRFWREGFGAYDKVFTPAAQ
jgi:hypothetical protein